jgi:hypothetical protein
MAITVLRKTSPYHLDGGQQGQFQQDFVCAWSTTDATGTVPSGIRKVRQVNGFTWMQIPADDEIIYVSNTLNADGSLVLATGDLISLGRTSFTPTSGGVFCFSIKGYV